MELIVKAGNNGNLSDLKVPSPVQQYEYIADLLKELKSMAEGLEADVLAHIIEVAMLEAYLQLEIEIDPQSHDI